MTFHFKERFTRLIAPMDAALFQACSQGVLTKKDELIDGFYHQLLADHESSVFLVATAVEMRLKPGMATWLEQLISCDSAGKFEAFMALQQRIGEAHGRAEISLHLVLRAMNHLKRACVQLLEQHVPNPKDFIRCVNFYQGLFEMSFEILAQFSVLAGHEHSGYGVSLKLLEALLDPLNERERQLHALSQWESQVFLEVAMNQPVSLSQQLGFSAFALWLTHKAAMHFEGNADFQRIRETIAQIDHTTLPKLGALSQAELSMSERTSLLLTLRQQVSAIRLLLNTIFDQLEALDVGQDSLTQLLNRRFLPAIFQREIKLARQSGSHFAVAMIDIDFFKRINDSHGHEAGDLVLKQVALVMQRQVRASDFLFRYGGEEFLLILVEVSADQALAVTEQLRKAVEQHAVTLISGDVIKATISIGVSFDAGHADYQHIIQCADEALYQAKRSGRNRVIVAAKQ